MKSDHEHSFDHFGNVYGTKKENHVDLYFHHSCFCFFFLHLKKYNNKGYYSYSLFAFLVVYLLFDSACVCVLLQMYKLFYNNTWWMSHFVQKKRRKKYNKTFEFQWKFKLFTFRLIVIIKKYATPVDLIISFNRILSNACPFFYPLVVVAVDYNLIVFVFCFVLTINACQYHLIFKDLRVNVINLSIFLVHANVLLFTV